jgi:hypothetical protein
MEDIAYQGDHDNYITLPQHIEVNHLDMLLIKVNAEACQIFLVEDQVVAKAFEVADALLTDVCLIKLPIKGFGGFIKECHCYAPILCSAFAEKVMIFKANLKVIAIEVTVVFNLSHGTLPKDFHEPDGVTTRKYPVLCKGVPEQKLSIGALSQQLPLRLIEHLNSYFLRSF